MVCSGSVIAILSFLPLTLTALSSMAFDAESTKRLDSWKDRWDGNRIGWHENGVHDAILRYGDEFLPSAGGVVRVFVPLCGKTVDLAYFATSPRVSQVVGIDGIPTALDTFAAEQPQLKLTKQDGDDSLLVRYRNEQMELLCGDFFTLDAQQAGGQFGAIFDRASMVAIQPDLREAYVNTLDSLLTESGTIMLVVLERVSGTDWDKEGPPFSIPVEEVRRWYTPDKWVVKFLDEKPDDPSDRPMISKYYKIQRVAASSPSSPEL